MKTFSIILIIGMFMGQLSFGSGNGTCCPDSSGSTLLATTMQVQLDQLQAQSQQVIPSLPSLGVQVAQKLGEQHFMLHQMQLETEGANIILPQSHAKQLQLKLNNRIQTESEALKGGRIQF